ncbi:hypothetical protein L6452_12847 [Arctium lappa]|uniref:Uncharacterized protein n=1 Tax=Arctium lappa TaxID=4217 RepID=A0ACB9CGL5_ARCLA|nr:hypothetical protein L6452_12847 [Arctium lappa]
MSLVSGATLTNFLHRRNTSSPANHLPPSPPKLPIIGHLHLLTDLPHQSLSRLADQYGPLIYLRLGQVPTIVVQSPQFAELVLKTHDHIFSNRAQLVAAQYLSYGCSDVTFSNRPYWHQARKFCVTELLSPKRVNSFQAIRDDEVTRLLHVVSTRSGLEVDISVLFFQLANDMLCLVAFGKRFLREESRGNEEKDWNLSGIRRRLMKNLKELSEVYDDIINEHRKKREESTSGNGYTDADADADAGKEDFVDVLLRVQRQHDLEVPITDDNVKAIVLTEIEFRGPDFRYIPFGGGRRGCPGYAFGLATVEITLARLLYHFDWDLLPGTGPEDVDLDESFGLSTKKKTALKLVPTESKKHGLKKDGARVSPI